MIARTIADWSACWVGHLLQTLRPAIAKEARCDLAAGPAALLRAGLADKLFASDPFQGALAALPAFVKPVPHPLPAVLTDAVASLQQMIDRIDRALASWNGAKRPVSRSRRFCRRSGAATMGTPTHRVIGRRLTSLLRIVEGVAPLNSAIEQARRREAAHVAYVAKKERIAACGRAAPALDVLVPLGGLAQKQVDTLRRKLHNRSEHWRRAIYRNATTFAPDLTSTEPESRSCPCHPAVRN